MSIIGWKGEVYGVRLLMGHGVVQNSEKIFLNFVLKPTFAIKACKIFDLMESFFVI